MSLLRGRFSIAWPGVLLTFVCLSAVGIVDSTFEMKTGRNLYCSRKRMHFCAIRAMHNDLAKSSPFRPCPMNKKSFGLSFLVLMLFVSGAHGQSGSPSINAKPAVATTPKPVASAIPSPAASKSQSFRRQSSSGRSSFAVLSAISAGAWKPPARQLPAGRPNEPRPSFRPSRSRRPAAPRARNAGRRHLP